MHQIRLTSETQKKKKSQITPTPKGMGLSARRSGGTQCIGARGIRKLHYGTNARNSTL